MVMGTSATGVQGIAPDGMVPDATDCDDGSAVVNPSGTEICDGVDNDCDGTIDPDSAIDVVVWYIDYMVMAMAPVSTQVSACEQPEGYASNADDCVDIDASIHPDVAEICDGVDNDCDGIIDPDNATDVVVWYIDHDGDGYGSSDYQMSACEQPQGYVENAEDCDDLNIQVNPLGIESCNGFDDDCDGVVDPDTSVDVSSGIRI